MSLELSQLQRLRTGPPKGSVVAGYMPDVVREYLGANLPIVHLSKESLAKINKKHKDLTDFDLLAVPHLLKSGVIITDENRKVVVVVGRIDKRLELYKMAVKLASSTYDSWMTAFYRTNEQHIRSILSKETVLRRGTSYSF